MLHKQRQNDDRIFASLALVDGHGPGQREFGEIGVVVADGSLIGKLHHHLLLFQVDAGHRPNIAVEHLALVVIDLLDHPVAHAQHTATTREFRFAWFRRVERLLEHDVELPGANLATRRRAEHLHLLGRVDPVFRQILADQVTNTLRAQFWFSSLQPETIGLRELRRWHKMRILSGVDTMGIRDDVAASLPV